MIFLYKAVNYFFLCFFLNTLQRFGGAYMFSTSKEPSNIKHVVLFLCLMPFIMIAVGLFYMWRMEAVLFETVQDSMHQVGAHAASVAEESLSETMGQLKSAAHNPLLQNAEKNRKDIFRYLREVMKRNNWYDMYVVDTKGYAHAVNGLRFSIALRPYFQRALAGHATTSYLIEVDDYATHVLAHAVPIFNDKHEVVTVLVALEEVSSPRFLHGITQDSGTNGVLAFVDKDGGWISQGIVTTQSFWKMVFKENAISPVADVLAFMQEQEKNSTPLLVNGQESFITVDVIGNTGWSVVGISPSEPILEKVDSILFFFVVFGLCMLVVMIFCVMYLYKVGKAYARYRNFSLAVANTNGIFYFYVDDQGFVHSANEYFYKQLGWEVTEKPMQLFEHVLGLTPSQLQDNLQSRTPFVLTMLPAQGHTFHMQCTVMPHVREGSMHLLLGTDISVYKANREMELVKTQYAELQQIINALPHALMVHSPEGLRLINKVAMDIVGVEAVEDMREGLLSGMDASTFSKQVQMVASVLRDGQKQGSTFAFEDASGREFVFENVQTPVFDDDGNVKYAVNVSIDITDTLRLQKQLEGELQRVHEILDSCPAGFFYENDEIVRYCNPAMQQMLRLEVGKPVPVADLNLEESVRSIVDQVDNGINVHDYPMAVVDVQGQERHLLVSTLGTTWHGKWHIMVWAHDVTTIHNVQQELMSAKDAAEAATRAKSDFLATMSHEIRTPMNAVLGFLQVFDKKNLHQTQLDYIEKITISAKGLLRIINDILDFSKIEANKMDLEYTAFNLNANMDAVYSIMAFSAQDKGLNFSRTIDEQVPVYVMGDGERLNQVLLNLLSNAIKFTEKGSISLHVGIQNRIDDEHFVLECSVSDTGIGLSEEQAQSLFKPFTQADTSTSRRFGGTGLGLVISQRIIQLMGGDIVLQSELGKGSIFTCSFPVRRANSEEIKRLQPMPVVMDAQSEQDREAALLENIKGKSVLVAEDNFINQEIAAAMLEEYELDLDFANNGQEAVTAVQKKQYELVFMDLQMPIMSGLDATKAIRALGQSDARYKNLPIIAMTANVMQEDRQSCQEAGMDDHVGKPISATILRQVLLKWLG